MSDRARIDILQDRVNTLERAVENLAARLVVLERDAGVNVRAVATSVPGCLLGDGPPPASAMYRPLGPSYTPDPYYPPPIVDYHEDGTPIRQGRPAPEFREQWMRGG